MRAASISTDVTRGPRGQLSYFLKGIKEEAAIIRSLCASLTAYNADTMRHCRAVARLAGRIARQLGLPPEVTRDIQLAALLHDLGKVGIPQEIIEKPGSLTLSERIQVEKHTGIGAEMLSASRLPDRLIPVVYHHHERWDGKGYPERLKGQQIPLGARIVAVADTYDAMTARRLYTKQKTEQEAIAEIRRQAGSQFDPRVVHAFLTVMTGPTRARAAVRPHPRQPWRRTAPRRSRFSALAALPALAAAAAVVLAVMVPGKEPRKQSHPAVVPAAPAVAMIALDINPSIELDVDRHARVTEARGINADGRSLLKDLRLTGTDLRAATALVAQRAILTGKLPQGGVVLATVVPLTPEARGLPISTLAAEGARRGIEQGRRTAAVLVAEAETTALAAAHRAGLPLGKYLLAHHAAATGQPVDLATLRAETVAQTLRHVRASRELFLMASWSTRPQRPASRPGHPPRQRSPALRLPGPPPSSRRRPRALRPQLLRLPSQRRRQTPKLPHPLCPKAPSETQARCRAPSSPAAAPPPAPAPPPPSPTSPAATLAVPAQPKPATAAPALRPPTAEPPPAASWRR